MTRQHGQRVSGSCRDVEHTIMLLRVVRALNTNTVGATSALTPHPSHSSFQGLAGLGTRRHLVGRAGQRARGPAPLLQGGVGSGLASGLGHAAASV
mmetsp:Transcript_18538/g.55904  ORF Transcript_18538/g.55904 Transcript_18538/m.55904 type:complete len:96 (+) Transcript_18538:684-971(+)